MVPALLKSYSDVTLFKMAEAAITVKEMKIVATNVQEQLIQVWLKSKKKPEAALADLGLGYTVDSILESPLFGSWFKYTNAYSTKYPQEKSTVIETLSRKFGAENVARMLGTAKSIDATRSIATKLESAQLEMWLRSGNSVDDIRELLRLYAIGDFTGESLLHTWVSYMNVFLKDNPEKLTSMLTKLETQFKDKPFHQILQAAMKFPSMESAASKLQAEKIQGYIAGNLSPQKVFKFLDLDHVGENLLRDPLFARWMRYLEDFNKKNSKHQESVFTPIRMCYNNRERMISMAMNNPNTVKVAKLLEREQSKYWLEEKNLPWYVFRFLGLKDAGEKPFVNRNFKTWAKYLNDFNRQYPEDKTTMIEALRANYYDIALVPILNAAKKDPKTEKLAMNLEIALVNKWVAEKEPLAVFKNRFSHIRFANELLERYANKLKAQLL